MMETREELDRQIAELQARRDALVEPLLLEAREIVAHENRDIPHFAERVLAGKSDQHSDIAIALAALRRGMELASAPAEPVEQRCPACHVKFQEIKDVDAHIAALSTPADPVDEALPLRPYSALNYIKTDEDLEEYVMSRIAGLRAKRGGWPGEGPRWFSPENLAAFTTEREGGE
jgi:hypothetical protein